MDDPVQAYLNLDRWGEVEIEEESNYLPESPSLSSESFLLGFIISHIVGLQYYSGSINGREMVGLVREPINPLDVNAIKVFNMQSIQVGYIERCTSRVLAPLIDAGLITIEGIVPLTPGSKHRYTIPFQIHIFARIESFPSLQFEISRGGLLLISQSSPSFNLSESLIVKEKKVERGVRSVDEIFKLVGSDESKKSCGMEVLVPPKNVIKTELFLHQKEGLGWLVHRENSQELPPFWEEKNGVYLNVLTNYETRMRPESLRGGIFADDMGLGKTLTLLSLIAITKPHRNNSEEEEREGEETLSFLLGKKSKANRVKRSVGSCKKQKVNETQENKGNTGSGPKTTLIVCPPSVFSTWLTQLCEHTRHGSLKVYMYYGDRTKDVNVLQKYDIVLTTYSTLASDYHSRGSPMETIEWFRVILDEAHLIKNAGALQSRAVINLKAKRRWVVTGTPIQNGSFDLFSLMAFLNFEPFSVNSYWQSLVQRPLNHGDENGLLRLQVLMATISLRRAKDNNLVGLPPKTIETCFVELSTEEREQYDQMEEEAKCVVHDYIRFGSIIRNYSTVLGLILRLRQICTDVALCPSDFRSLLPSNNIGDVTNNPELLKKLLSMLQDGDDFDCPICISPPTKTIITCCAHIFCRDCILKALKRQNACCPLCRRRLSESDLFLAPPESPDIPNTEIHTSERPTTSSKGAALLKFLIATRDENPSIKSVVFSQFRKMLILLEEPLKAAGFGTLRLDGSMTAKKRAQVINQFGDQGSGAPTVLLASLKSSGAGINLTAASRVYLMEPWWNPVVEEQAMDRVHRIGQKEDVKIVRLIARNSIEERILELQERKKRLAGEAFRRKSGKDRREIGMEDLRILMSL